VRRDEGAGIATRRDDDGYLELVADENGPAYLGCWLAIIAVASRCQPRGTLVRENGSPHTLDEVELTLPLLDKPDSSFTMRTPSKPNVTNTAADGSGTLVTDPVATSLRKVVLPGKKKPSPVGTPRLPDNKVIVPPASVKGEEKNGSKKAMPGKALGVGAMAHNSIDKLSVGSYVV
jgi:hypothetical protein